MIKLKPNREFAAFVLSSCIFGMAIANVVPEEMPKVSVKLSTSIVESAHPANLQQTNWTLLKEPAARQLIETYREQRSLRGQQLSRQYESGSQNVWTQPLSSDRAQNLYNSQAHNQQQNLIAAGKIIELQPLGYSRSVSSSWNVAPSSQLERRSLDSGLSRQEQITEPQARGWPARDLGNQQTIVAQRQCPRRSLSKILSNAKDLLTGGFSVIERSARSANFMLGSSILAATVPIIALIWPEGSTMRATFSDPLNSVAKLGLQGRVESVMGWVERSIEHLPNFPRLHPQECVKRIICEAHNEPDRYGAIGFTLRLLFPATNISVTDRWDNMEYKVVNKYRHAAGYGLNHRLDTINNNNSESTGFGLGSRSACKEKYEDCIVSLLDVAQNIIDMFAK